VNSIRVFLVAVILAVITLFYFVAALRGYQSSMLEADRLFDKQLLDTARLIANIHAEETAGNLGHDASMAFQVWRGERLVASSRNAPDAAIGAFEPGFDYSNFAGYRWRTAAYFDSARGNWILVADRTDMRFALAENVILESLFPTLAGLPVVGLLIWVIVSGGLRPLRALAGELAGKSRTTSVRSLSQPPSRSWSRSSPPATACWSGCKPPCCGKGSSPRTPRTNCARRSAHSKCRSITWPKSAARSAAPMTPR
jgi:hypothetical protein